MNRDFFFYRNKLLCAFEVGTIAGVHTNLRVVLDEQGNHHLGAGFDGAFAENVSARVSLYCRRSVDNHEVDEGRRNDFDRHDGHGLRVFPPGNFDCCTVKQPDFAAVEVRFCDFHGFLRRVVEEVPGFAVVVEICHFGVGHIGFLDGVPALPCALERASGNQVLDANAVEGLALAWLHELVFDDFVWLTINHDFEFLAEFVGANSTHIILFLVFELNLAL